MLIPSLSQCCLKLHTGEGDLRYMILLCYGNIGVHTHCVESCPLLSEVACLVFFFPYTLFNSDLRTSQWLLRVLAQPSALGTLLSSNVICTASHKLSRQSFFITNTINYTFLRLVLTFSFWSAVTEDIYIPLYLYLTIL